MAGDRAGPGGRGRRHRRARVRRGRDGAHARQLEDGAAGRPTRAVRSGASMGSAGFIAGSLGTGVLIDRTGAPGLFLVLVPGVVLASVLVYALLGGGPPRRRTATMSPLEGLVGIVRHPTLS